jgi:hypothetical protein
MNHSEMDVDVTGWRLTAGTDIRGGYVLSGIMKQGESWILYCDLKREGDERFTGYTLSEDGVTLLLTDAQDEQHDSMDVPAMPAGQVCAFPPELWEQRITSPFDNIGAGVDLSHELTPQSAMNGVYISGLMAANASTLKDAYGNPSDWIEIANGSDDEIDLNGYSLSTDAFNRREYVFPSVILPAGERLIVFASGAESTQQELHAPLKLPSEDGAVRLYDPMGTPLSYMDYDELERDQALVRTESGRLVKTKEMDEMP